MDVCQLACSPLWTQPSDLANWKNKSVFLCSRPRQKSSLMLEKQRLRGHVSLPVWKLKRNISDLSASSPLKCCLWYLCLLSLQLHFSAKLCRIGESLVRLTDSSERDWITAYFCIEQERRTITDVTFKGPKHTKKLSRKKGQITEIQQSSNDLSTDLLLSQIFLSSFPSASCLPLQSRTAKAWWKGPDENSGIIKEMVGSRVALRLAYVPLRETWPGLWFTHPHLLWTRTACWLHHPSTFSAQPNRKKPRWFKGHTEPAADRKLKSKLSIITMQLKEADSKSL